ncbi:hypothetical protein Pelo_1848 [Pelomyxa schiedti]|nr:hypothetical protein Pelo_1848 [Pelomyxa schiedti]
MSHRPRGWFDSSVVRNSPRSSQRLLTSPPAPPPPLGGGGFGGVAWRRCGVLGVLRSRRLGCTVTACVGSSRASRRTN